VKLRLELWSENGSRKHLEVREVAEVPEGSTPNKAMRQLLRIADLKLQIAQKPAEERLHD
jgi:hypothetical protein